MAAFLTVDILRAHAASVCLHEALGFAQRSGSPRHWQRSVSTPFFPPPD
jgi:hypothetical protein